MWSVDTKNISKLIRNYCLHDLSSKISISLVKKHKMYIFTANRFATTHFVKNVLQYVPAINLRIRAQVQ